MPALIERQVSGEPPRTIFLIPGDVFMCLVTNKAGEANRTILVGCTYDDTCTDVFECPKGTRLDMEDRASVLEQCNGDNRIDQTMHGADPAIVDMYDSDDGEVVLTINHVQTASPN